MQGLLGQLLLLKDAAVKGSAQLAQWVSPLEPYPASGLLTDFDGMLQAEKTSKTRGQAAWHPRTKLYNLSRRMPNGPFF